MAKTLTREEWRKVESELAHPHGRVILLVDGYTLTLQVTPIKPLRYVITPWINGQFLGKWMMEDCEERRRFLRPSERYIHPTKTRHAFAKEFGKRALARSSLDRRITQYYWDWPNYRALRRHLLANNQDIEVVSCGY